MLHLFVVLFLMSSPLGRILIFFLQYTFKKMKWLSNNFLINTVYIMFLLEEKAPRLLYCAFIETIYFSEIFVCFCAKQRRYSKYIKKNKEWCSK